MFRRQGWHQGWGTLGLLVAVAGSGCATRTVYVVQDPQPQQMAPPSAAPGLSAGPMANPGATQYNNGGEAVITSSNQFYQPLSNYGSWMDYPGYGQVFVPAQSVVGANFRPYTYGHWEYTQFGWTWVDHHPFGWATGHYGSWMYDGRVGWAWVPGTQWAPAWVSWRQGGGYVGWAPMPPGAAFGGSYNTFDSSWVFCTTTNFGQGFVGGYLVTGAGYQQGFQSTQVINQTTIINNQTTYVGPGEDARREGRVVHRPIEDTEREFATTRPPRGTVIDRSGSARNASGAPTANPPTGRGDDPGRGSPMPDRGVAQPVDPRSPNVPDRGAATPVAGVPDRGAATPNPGVPGVPDRGVAQPVPSRDPPRTAAPLTPVMPAVPGQAVPSRDPAPVMTPVMPAVPGQAAPSRGDALTPVMPIVPGRTPTVTTPNQPTAPVRTPVMPVQPVQPVQPAVPGIGSKDRDGTAPVTGGVPNYPPLPEKRLAQPPEAFERARGAQGSKPVAPGPVEARPNPTRPSQAGQVVPFNDRVQPASPSQPAQPSVQPAQPVAEQPKAQPSRGKGSKSKASSKGKTRSPK